jgi:gluconolactonase
MPAHRVPLDRGPCLLGLHVPEVAANFTFGGAKRNRLFITATSSLYSILVNFDGARYPTLSS